jgi:predicted DNA binding CopG/RHH family protein
MGKPKNEKFDAPYADAEEAELMSAVEGGAFSEEMALSRAKKDWQAAARATLRKKPITIRIQEQDIAAIKALALERGIPYQTLVASILHRFARGTLREDA